MAGRSSACAVPFLCSFGDQRVRHRSDQFV